MGDARLRRRRDGRLWHKGRRRRIVVVNVDIVFLKKAGQKGGGGRREEKERKAPRRGGVWGGAPGLITVSTVEKKKPGQRVELKVAK